MAKAARRQFGMLMTNLHDYLRQQNLDNSPKQNNVLQGRSQTIHSRAGTQAVNGTHILAFHTANTIRSVDYPPERHGCI